MNPLNMLSGFKQLLSMNALPYFAGIAAAALLAGVTVGGYGVWKLRAGQVAEAKLDTERAKLQLARFTAQLAADAAVGQEQARKDQEAARTAMDAHQTAIEGALAAGFAGVRSAVAADNAKLRGLISDQKYDCLRVPLPADYLRLLNRPGGTVPAGGGQGAGPAATAGDVPHAAAGDTER